MMLTPTQLLAIAPGLGSKASPYAGCLNRYLDFYGIDSLQRLAYFLGQVLTESEDLSAFREGMNYSAERLRVVWPLRFPTIELAKQYERNPAKLANFVYGGRMGNGGPASGDGWRFRGAGWIQLTGHDNQAEFAKAIGMQVSTIGDYLATPEGAAQSACWFWWKHGCNRLADFGNIDAVSDAINIGRLTEKVGDAEGYAKRVAKTALAKKVLGVK